MRSAIFTLVGTPRKNIIGQRFGRLVVIGLCDEWSKGGHRLVQIRCDCGTVKSMVRGGLINGRTKSCGCLRSETLSSIKTKHGHATRKHGASREYITLRAMLQRCYDSNQKSFANYGGRGITVCDRWRYGENGLTGIECFVIDMGRRPSTKHSLDRLDNSSGYGPSNCQWATRKTQVRNRRSTKSIMWEGKQIALASLCERFGIPYSVVIQRIKKLGWKPKAALTIPVQERTT